MRYMNEKTRNKIIIGAFYGFSAANCIVAWLTSLTACPDKDSSIIILGIILLIMVPLSITDTRKEMLSNFSAWMGIIMHVWLGFMLSFLYWWMFPASVVEAVILICLFFTLRQNKKNRKNKKK